MGTTTTTSTNTPTAYSAISRTIITPMSNVLLTLLSPFTRAISTMLYLVGVAVGMATGVMVGFGETISAPAKAVGRLLPANQTHGYSIRSAVADAQQKLRAAAYASDVPAVANAMPGVPVLQPYGSSTVDTPGVALDEPLKHKLEQAWALRSRLEALLPGSA